MKFIFLGPLSCILNTIRFTLVIKMMLRRRKKQENYAGLQTTKFLMMVQEHIVTDICSYISVSHSLYAQQITVIVSRIIEETGPGKFHINPHLSFLFFCFQQKKNCHEHKQAAKKDVDKRSKREVLLLHFCLLFCLLLPLPACSSGSLAEPAMVN